MRQALQQALEALKIGREVAYKKYQSHCVPMPNRIKQIEIDAAYEPVAKIEEAIAAVEAALAEQRLQATDKVASKVASSPEVATLEPYGYVIEQGEYKTGFFDADAKRDVEFLVSQHGGRVIRLYTVPQQRKPLSDDIRSQAIQDCIDAAENAIKSCDASDSANTYLTRVMYAIRSLKEAHGIG